jgi:hypothetical protein
MTPRRSDPRAAAIRARRAPRAAFAGAAVLTALLSTGCASASGEASCARLITFDKRAYLDVGDRPGAANDVDLVIGDRLGNALLEDCDDTNDERADSPPWKPEVYAIKGLDSSVAIAVGDSRDELELFARHEQPDDMPPEVLTYLKNHRSSG